MPVTLAVDIGNSRIKGGVFENGSLVRNFVYTHAEFLALGEAEGGQIIAPGALKYLAYLSVGKAEIEARLLAFARLWAPEKTVKIDRNTPMPVGNRYATPETLGMDRIVAAAGAYLEAGKRPVLAIDAGTAITYEYVDAAGDYRGGGISPGLRLRFRALDEFTAKLPLIEARENFPLVGTSTEESIRSGVQYGLLGEIEGVVSRYKEMAGEGLQVYLTGGDAEFLGNHLKNINFVDPNLLLRGIYYVIQHKLPDA